MAISKFLYIYYHTCPKCGNTVRISTNNGSTKCSNCKCTVEVRNGQVVGTR